MKWVIGIDEAGRGPLAGPVAVCAASVRPHFDWKLLASVTDSKLLSERERTRIFKEVHELKKAGVINYKVSMVGANVIDKIGINSAVALGIMRVLQRLDIDPASASIRLDGLLVAPAHFDHQETIVGGDRKEKVIGLASIMAKVTRDRYMTRKGVDFPEYGFHTHKGYGTEAHKKVLNAVGPCTLHRETFVHINRMSA